MRVSVDELVGGVRQGDRRSLAQAITLVESANPSDDGPKIELLNALLDQPTESIRLGISGTPGVGKSTLIEALGTRLIGKGHRVAVLAVDPSSERTGGSILGDKTRMPQLAVHRDAFVRPSPAAGGIGGITGSTADTIRICEAAGFDIVIVETVGVGQSETAVAGVTDLFLLLHSPGGGDELQGIKRGVMELADRIAVTKADGDLLPASSRAAAGLRSALHLMRPKPGRQVTSVDLCSALTGEGLDQLLDALFEQHARLVESGELLDLRQQQRVQQFTQALEDGVSRKAAQDPRSRITTDRVLELVKSDSISPVGAAIQVLAAVAEDDTEINAVTLLVSHMQRSVEFYTTLGFPIVFGGPDAEFTTLGHGKNFLNLQHSPAAAAVVLWGRPIFFVPDPDAVHARALAAGLIPSTAPTDAPWGERYFHISDPDGHELSFARRLD